MTEATADFAAGTILDGRYRLERPLGGGGAAAVWRARDLEADDAVAVKLLHPRLRAHPTMRARLLEEGQLLQRFLHPNLARCRAVALEPAQPFLVMDLIDGVGLDDALGSRAGQDPARERPFDRYTLVRLVHQMASAVDYAHGHGVVHRDLKPSNVMLVGPAGRFEAVVLDFGIAKLLDRVDAGQATTQGRVLGSGFYMAPEQARGEAIGPTVDVFALGAVAFEALTLRRAWVLDGAQAPLPAFSEPARLWDHNQPGEVLRRMSEGPRPRPSRVRPELPEALDAVFARALASHPEDRYATAGAFAADVQAALGISGEAPTAPTAVTRPDPVTGPRVAGRGETAANPRVLGLQPDLPVSVTEIAPTPDLAPTPEVDPTVTARREAPSVAAWDETAPTRAPARPPLGDAAPSRSAVAPAVGTRAGPWPDGATAAAPAPARAPRRGPAPWVWGLVVLGVAAGAFALGRRSAPSPPALAAPEAAAPAPAAAPPAPAAAAAPVAAPRSGPAAPAGQIDAPRRAREAPPRRPRSPPPAAPPVPTSRLRADLERARTAGADPAALDRLARAIGAEAASITDPAQRTRVRRIAASSALVGDVEGIARALDLLESARR